MGDRSQGAGRQGSRPGYRCSPRRFKYGGLEILSTETVQGQRSGRCQRATGASGPVRALADEGGGR